MANRIKVGIQLPEVEREVPWPEIREMARTAEAVGVDSLWLGDHLLYRDPINGARGPWEAWSSLAALAEATDRVLLGPLVASTSFHNPAMIAKKAGTVDEISGGRLILGLGAGWNRVEYEAFGFPYDNRASRFEEAFHIIRTLIRAGEIDHDGRFYTMHDMELLPRARSDIPLLIGSNSPRMLRMTMPHVDMWNTWYSSYGNTTAGLAPLMADVDAACFEVGRDPGEVERTAAVFVQFEGGSGRIAGSSEHPAVEAITGSSQEIAEALAAFGDAGVGHLQAVLDPNDTRSVERLGEVLRLLG
jgi:alkanesulfonate monooxygenase SsuD/methylene tetrahydromethanopterin reductase-like flavin-dependent oxidoreductase (luciferase family)